MADAAVVKMIFAGMAGSFQPDKAARVSAVIQYDITGEGGGQWNAVIADGTCAVNEGVHDAPNMTLTMDAQDWIDMITGKLDGQQAFNGPDRMWPGPVGQTGSAGTCVSSWGDSPCDWQSRNVQGPGNLGSAATRRKLPRSAMLFRGCIRQ